MVDARTVVTWLISFLLGVIVTIYCIPKAHAAPARVCIDDPVLGRVCMSDPDPRPHPYRLVVPSVHAR
jgi:hypothetical protein